MGLWPVAKPSPGNDKNFVIASESEAIQKEFYGKINRYE